MYCRNVDLQCQYSHFLRQWYMACLSVDKCHLHIVRSFYQGVFDSEERVNPHYRNNSFQVALDVIKWDQT